MKIMPPESGYTLFEMLIVLTILGLIAAVTVPLLRGGAEAGLVLRTAERLAADLATVRLAAIKGNREATLDIDLVNNSYSGLPALAQRMFPAQMPVKVSAANASSDQAGLASIRFFPNGGSLGARITLGAGAQVRVLSIDPLTGLVRIERPPL
jgi:general secretion pathway protein H